MKRIILPLMFSVVCCELQAQTFMLTASRSNNLKNQCVKSAKNYYGGLSLLMGAYISAEEKNEIIFKTQEEFFRNPDTRIESDIIALSQQDYKVQEYLDNISLLYGKVDNAEVSVTNTTISEVYYNDIERYYFLIAFVEREITVTKNDKKNTVENDKKVVDIYFSFTPDSKLKIFSIQNHKKGILKGRIPEPIVSDADAERKLDKNKPYYIFDIKPSYADIIVDGKNLYNIYGEKVITTRGKHIIEIIASNYNSVKFDVVVTDTGAQMIKRKLIKKQGYLSVNSISQFHDANVYVDGEYVDVVPLSNYLLPVGFHKIVVKKKGFFSFNETVRISDDKTTSLNVKLNSNKWVKQAAVGAGAIILYNILKR